MTKHHIAFVLTFLAALALAAPDDAEAARLGGGRSFGGRSSGGSFSGGGRSPGSMVPPRPSPSASEPTRPSPSMNESMGTKASSVNPGVGAMAAPGMSRGFGMLGGLMAGTLLGSLFMGHAFSGPGFLDVLLIGGAVFLVLRLLRRKRGTGARKDDPAMPRSFRDLSSSLQGQSEGVWDRSREPLSGREPFLSTRSSWDPRQKAPTEFDPDDFLRGAKALYVRMQESWDRRDLDDIAQFASPGVMDVLQQQYAEEPEPSTTDLIMVNASMLDMAEDGPLQRAAVLFDVLMRENSPLSPGREARSLAETANPEQVREIWHFVRPLGSDQPWRLDGIDQAQ